MSRPVLSNLGFVLQIAGIIMLLPIIAGFWLNETNALIAYFMTTIAFFATGFLFNTFSKREHMDLKSSSILMMSVFFLLGLIGSIPYLYLGTFPGTPLETFTNSFFESLSGYTTAGVTMISDVDSMPESLVLYRSLSQWIGGVGIIFVLLAFFYPGEKTVKGLGRAFGLDRVIAGIKLVLSHVLLLYMVYAAILITIVYIFGFTDLIQSASLIMSSLATGGLSPITDFANLTNSPIFYFIIIGMFLGSLNFFVHDKLVHAKVRGLFKNEFLAFIAIIAIGIAAFYFASGIGLKDSVFNVFAASTTAGFSSVDIYDLNDASKLILMSLMLIGGMSFSTSGGMKVFRVVMFLKTVPWVMHKLLYNAKGHMVYEGDRIDQRDVHVFMILPGLVFLLLFISVAIFVAHGFSFEDAVFESISSYSLTGFSTGMIDAQTSITLKWWLILLFVIGRVEIIAFLIILMRRSPRVGIAQ